MFQVIPIDDADDPRIEPYRRVKERDLAGRDGAFVLEGEVVLRAFARAGRHELASVLLAEGRVAKLAPLVAELPPAPVYSAPQGVLDQIVGFAIHRGVLALGRRGAEPHAATLLAGLQARSLVVVVFGIGNHDNMGAIFRNAAAFGAGAVLLDATCCDPLYRKAIRVSVGAALTMPFARLGRGDNGLGLLAAHGFEALAFSPGGAGVLSDLKRADRMALLFGAEGPGLPPEILARARAVAIPMASGFDSLNVATTCGVALHHLMLVAKG
jgi:tRNA G18 (ribose-2'-O)-methylase SpoU